MNKIEKSNFILEKLNELFPRPDLSLKFANGFTLLVAVMLSSQCTDATVNKVTERLFSLADNPQKMLDLGLEKIKGLIMPCGFFNTKAKSIIETSKQILEKHNGEIPSDFESLEALRGVGHKTASVIIGQYFHKPAFPVDTHIARLANRWGIAKSKNVKNIELELKRFFAQKDWNKLHVQMILYGRKYCPAKGHVINKCPICSAISNNTIY